MTQVINLIGGSGLGKSTIAAGLFYHLKLQGASCELVQEYVKSFAWAGRKLEPLDQITIVGEQAKREKLLYGKVDTVITDSPLLLGAIYDLYYNKEPASYHAVTNFIHKSKVPHHYYFLMRNKPFDPKGRFETEEQAKDIDNFCINQMLVWGVPFTLVEGPNEERVHKIMKHYNAHCFRDM